MGPPIYGRSFSTQQENFLQSLQNRGFQERNFQNGLPNGTRQSECSNYKKIMLIVRIKTT